MRLVLGPNHILDIHYHISCARAAADLTPDFHAETVRSIAMSELSTSQHRSTYGYLTQKSVSQCSVAATAVL